MSGRLCLTSDLALTSIKVIVIVIFKIEVIVIVIVIEGNII